MDTPHAMRELHTDITDAVSGTPSQSFLLDITELRLSFKGQRPDQPVLGRAETLAMAQYASLGTRMLRLDVLASEQRRISSGSSLPGVHIALARSLASVRAALAMVMRRACACVAPGEHATLMRMLQPAQVVLDTLLKCIIDVGADSLGSSSRAEIQFGGPSLDTLLAPADSPLEDVCGALVADPVALLENLHAAAAAYNGNETSIDTGSEHGVDGVVRTLLAKVFTDSVEPFTAWVHTFTATGAADAFAHALLGDVRADGRFDTNTGEQIRRAALRLPGFVPSAVARAVLEAGYVKHIASSTIR